MTTKVITFPLRPPLSLRAEIEKLAAADGTSMNQFLVMAAAEKMSAIRTADSFFAARRAPRWRRSGGGDSVSDAP